MRPVAARDLDLLGGFYEALIDPTHLGTALKELGDVVGAFGGSIHTLAAPRLAHELDLPISARSTWVCAYGPSTEVTRTYEEHYLYSDPWSRSPRGTHGNCYVSRDLIEPSELVKTAFYADCCRPVGIGDWMGATVLHERSRRSVRVSFVGRQFDGAALDH